MRHRHDPLARVPASPSDIKRYRRDIESMPVAADDGLVFDFDERSEKRMTEIVSMWREAGLQSIEWRMHDNKTQPLNHAQLRDYLQELQVKRMRRALQVYSEYRSLREAPGVTLRDLEDWKRGHKP